MTGAAELERTDVLCLCVLQLSRAMPGSSWKCRPRSAHSVRPEAIPWAAGSASTNGIPCLLGLVAWRAHWKTVPMETTSSPVTGLSAGSTEICICFWNSELISPCYSSQLLLGASRKLHGVQQGWVHGVSHLRSPPEEAGLCQLRVPVSRQQSAVWVLCEFQALYKSINLLSFYLSGSWVCVFIVFLYTTTVKCTLDTVE